MPTVVKSHGEAVKQMIKTNRFKMF